MRDCEFGTILKTLLKSITQKGNAFLGLGQFDAAKGCYESLRTFGDNTTADSYLKKLDDAQERDAYCIPESLRFRL